MCSSGPALPRHSQRRLAGQAPDASRLLHPMRSLGPPAAVSRPRYEYPPSYPATIAQTDRSAACLSHRPSVWLLDSGASEYLTGDFDPGSTSLYVKEKPRVPRRRKVVRPVSDPNADDNMNCPSRKHGIGKGLMTLWRVTNPGGGNFPPGVDFLDKGTMSVSHISTSKSQKTPSRNKRPQQRTLVMRRLVNNHKNKYNSSVNRRKVKCIKEANRMKVCNDKCELALAAAGFEESIVQCSGLLDDEELELRELQAGGPNPLSCSAHFATNGWQCCSLCKDLLAKFPPGAVNMKQPFPIQPWDSSPKLVKKLFKVFHFLYTYAVTIDIFPFTLDEFAEAFHEKDSLLLGKIHVSLLKFLFSGVEMELSRGCTSRVSKNFLFLRLLHSVEHQESILKLWKEFLNPLTWSEILHQVLVAAGFGSKEDILRRKYINKEVGMMAKYGLRPGTLKYVLFNILSEQGTGGMKVSDLANSLQMSDFNLHGATKEVENLISSTLASDVTLFEKISLSAYRLRINSGTEGENFQSDNEDSGSVDDATRNIGECSSDSDCDSLTADASKDKQASHCQNENSLSIVHTEIDESNPEEAWLLGLMEGEYSNLCIEEKLDVLVALVDLLDSASSITMEDPVNTPAEYAPSVHVSSGAKVKRSPAKEHDLLRTSWVAQKEEAPLEPLPVDSLALMLNPGLCEKYVSEKVDDNDLEVGFHLHPMQSIFLGSDRRYNRYWLFLGPCNSDDLGHKRIYFESSEDGHWEVIDSEVALCSLLSTLDCRGRREAFLLASLEKRQNALCQAMSSRTAVNAGNNQLTRSDQTEIVMVGEDGSSPVSGVENNICLTEVSNDPLVLSGAKVVDQTVKKREVEKQKWSNLQAFDAWVWDSFYCNLNVVKHRRTYFDPLTRCESCHDLFWRDEKHCETCHLTFELDFDLEERYTIHAAMCRERENISTFPKHKVLPSQLQSLKAAMHAIECFMPNDALVGAWTKSAHNLWIKRLRRTSSLVELLQVISDFVGAMREEWLCESNSSLEEIVANFRTLLPTSSEVALWLVKLDALITRLVTPGCRTMSRGRRLASWKA